MKNLYFRVITIAIGLCFAGTMTNPSRKSSILFNFEHQWDKYLLTNRSTGKHDTRKDVSQIAGKVEVSFHLFKVLFRSHMIKEWKIKHLDLSNNRISKMTLSSLAHLHALEILNLSNNAIHSISLDLPGPRRSRPKRHRSNFQNGLPFLKMLILQRNKLSDAPEGLWKLKSLQSLDLSFNGILQIGLSDFHHCLQLENIYLKSNKILKIHPEAFKDLKKLQVVDLSNNVLTTILPMMTIALEFPHLEVDLADNQWQCDDSVAVFQSFISESWRKKWNVICSKSVGNEEADSETPKSRISRETHLPHTNLNHMKSLIRNKEERPQEGIYVQFSTLGKEAHTGSALGEMQAQWPGEVRSSHDVQATGRKEDECPDLALATCLSVFITFIVAFGLGAFTRPYVDRLWQQRCRNKSPGSDNAYSNQGFYDDINAVGSTQHPRADLFQNFHHQNIYENQSPPWVTEPSPHATVIPDRTLGNSRKEPGHWQSSKQCRDHTGAGSGKDKVLPSGCAARSTLQGHPDAGNHQLLSAAQDHAYRNDILGELHYDTVAPEYSLNKPSVGVSSMAGTLQTVSGLTHDDLNELGLSHSREVAASLSNMLPHTNTQGGTGESKERGSPEQSPLETTGSQVEFSKEMQASDFISLLGAHQPRLQGAKPEEELSAIYSAVTHSDPGDADPSALPPRWGSGLDVTPATKKPVQKDGPSDLQYDLETDYDSDEGSLFTLSSEGSEDGRNVMEEEANGEESSRAGHPLQVKNTVEHKNNVTSVESLEDNITFQRILGKYETLEDHFGKPLISGPDSTLCENPLQSTSNTSESENPLIWPRSLDNKPLSDGTPGVVVYNYNMAPEPEAVQWRYSLKDLQFLKEDILPPSPPHSAKDLSNPEASALKEN